MKLKISLKWTWFNIGIIWGVFPLVIVFFLLNLPNQGFYAKPTAAASISYQSPLNLLSDSGIPIRLRIPKINVNAAIDSVGLTPQGAVDVPKDPDIAAWFNLGPHPGENGNSIIDGHLDSKSGAAAVFSNLHKLRKGDKLYVEDAKKSTATFVVHEFRTYGRNQNAPDIFIANDGKAHLNLITCEGLWNKTQKTYSNRLVVFADKE